MAGPIAPTRDQLKKIFKDQRSVLAFEKLFKAQDDVVIAQESIEAVSIEAGLGVSRAQQSLDLISAGIDYGLFFDTTDQSALAEDTPKAISFNTVQIAKGILIDTSKIVISKTGVYKIEFRIQL